MPSNPKIAEGQIRQPEWHASNHLRVRIQALHVLTARVCSRLQLGDGRGFLESLGELDAAMREVREQLQREPIIPSRRSEPESHGERRGR